MRGVAGNSRHAVRLPLFLTVAVHLGALLLTLVAPRLIPGRLQIPEVYQVELYAAPESPPSPQPSPVVVEPPPIITQPPPAGNPPKAQDQPTSSAPVSPPLTRPAAISLSPIKARLAKEHREREEQARRDRQVADRVTQLKLNLQQQRAETRAREAARLAREAIAETYRVTPTRPVQLPGDNLTKPQSSAATPQGAVGSARGVSSEVQSAYKAGLRGHIGRHWSLPDLQGWDKSLKTVINIKMKSNGMVSPGGVTISSPSGNPRFDREARKAVNNALPLPPLPAEFGKNGEEIAVTFTPGGLK